MCDCAGNSKPRKLNLPVNKNAEILNNTNAAVKNTNVKNSKKNKNAANGAAVPTEKTSKTAAFIASLFAKFL